MKYETTVSLVLAHFLQIELLIYKECLLNVTAHKFSKSSASYLGFPRESIKRRFLISHVLCRGHRLVT